jgi:Chaperone of endosialidase
MKHLYNLIFAAVALLSLVHSNASAQTSPTISYQGILQNNGANMNGIDTLKILIYTAETGGSPIYSETQAVSVANGVFNMAIGSVTPLLPTLDFTKQYYLAVSVNGAPELSPRSEVSFAPYAFRALNADTANYATTATIAKGVSGGVVTNINGFYGPLTLSGADGITIANSVGSLTIGNSGVQSLNGVGGILSLVGAGGTTVAHTGSTFTITSTGSGSGGIVNLVSTDNTLAITNPFGPIDTVNLARQSANPGQVLEWNGSAWRPTTLSTSQGGPDSINNLADAKSVDSNVFLGNYSGINDSAYRILATWYGNFNTAIGIKAMQANTTGNNNAACGYYTLGANTSGTANSAFGLGSLSHNTSGINNTAVGFATASGNITGGGNTAVGEAALLSSTTGSANVAIGQFAMSGGNGSMNTACGYGALSSNGGTYNVGVGYYALLQNQNGTNNTAIGDSAGAITASSYNNTTCLGSGAQPTASNQVVLGNAAVTSLYCQGAYAATTAASANMVVTSTGQIMRSTSSARYKTDIHDLDINTDKLYDLRPVSYISRIDGNPYFGLVAEDVAKVIPEMAEYARSKDVIPGSKSDELIPDAVKYPMLSVLLLEELKKEHAKVVSDETQLESQAKIIADLERRVEAIEASEKSAH